MTSSTKNKMRLEYVASGCSFLRITYNDIYDHVDTVNGYFSEINENNGHYFSLLFNAYTESRFGECFEKFKPAIYKVHADSGGLQLVTRGTEAAIQTKRDIYKIQAKYAHIGMSFDEIPVILPKKKSKRGDLSGRFFDRDNLKSFAKMSGENLKDQIESFLDLKTECVPFMIIHGNDVDTAIEWTETLLDQIPEELRCHIGGIAMGGGSFGNGVKEALLRAFLAGHILKERNDLPNKRIHFLGLGSLRNSFPFISMMNSGHYLPEWTISYDSTTHTSGHHLGNYLNKNGKLVLFGRDNTHVYQFIHDEICSNVKTYKDHNQSRDELYKLLNSPVRKYVDGGGKFEDILHANLGIATSSIINFTRKLNEYQGNFKTFLKDLVEPNNWNLYQQAAKINSMDSYLYFDRHLGKMLDSKQTPEKTTGSLDEFF